VESSCVYILNMQSGTADKGWLSTPRVVWGAQYSSV